MRPPHAIIDGYPSRTISITTTDVAQSIPAAELRYNGAPVIGALVSCEDENVRFTVGDATPDAATQVGHIIQNEWEWVRLHGSKAVRTFQFVSAALQTAGIIHITLEFEDPAV